MKSFLCLFLSLCLSQCRILFKTEDPSTETKFKTDTLDHIPLNPEKLRKETLPARHPVNPPSQPKMKYFWKNRHNSQRKYWPEQREEVKMRKNMKPTKRRQIVTEDIRSC